MEQKTKELWIIPITIAIVTALVIGVFLIVWGGWYNGIHYHNPLSWMKDALFARVPVWGTLIIVALAAILAGLNIWQRARTQDYRFDAFADFSIDANPTGPWLYGFSPTLEGPITLHTTKQPGVLDGKADRWSSPRLCPHMCVMRNKTGSAFTGRPDTYDVPKDAIHMHPGSNGQFDVVRWTCPHDGRYSIVGDFSGLDHIGAPDVDVHVRKNSKDDLESCVLHGAPARKSFTSEVSMRMGDTLDFMVGVGQSGNYYNGSTGLRATVQRIGRYL